MGFINKLHRPCTFQDALAKSWPAGFAVWLTGSIIHQKNTYMKRKYLIIALVMLMIGATLSSCCCERCHYHYHYYHY